MDAETVAVVPAGRGWRWQVLQSGVSWRPHPGTGDGAPAEDLSPGYRCLHQGVLRACGVAAPGHDARPRRARGYRGICTAVLDDLRTVPPAGNPERRAAS